MTEYVESITEKSQGNMYKCPLCGSGTRPGGTGAFSIAAGGKRWKCFSCGKSGDVYDLIGLMYNTSDHVEQMKIASDLFKLRDAGDRWKKPAPSKEKRVDEAEADFTEFFLQASKHLEETDYLQRRGISLATARKYNLGYVAAWKNPKAQAAPASPRLIIPTSKGSYLARDTREHLTEKEVTYKALKVGKIHLFNVGALKGERPVYVVEGEIDALSIIEAGGQAVALGSVSMVPKFIKYVEEQKCECPIIVALDNDEAGQAAASKLTEGLQERGFCVRCRNIAGEYKDPNEALLRGGRDALQKEIEQAERELIEERTEEERNRKEEYKKTSAGGHIQEFLDGIAESASTPAIDTGFFHLNKALGDSYLEVNGGLYEGLYVVGAISSLGKTTFCLQLCDQVAEAGHDVLIFSLEMARSELMSKSISRLTAKVGAKQNVDTRLMKTARGITAGDRWKKYSDKEKALIKSAVQEYAKFANRVYIQEGIGDIGVGQIRAAVKEHIHLTGNKPVVLVDYLQILAPYNERATDKQNTDKAILELKRISRDFKIPLIGVSSFNRSSYQQAVSMEAFKESGAIEYSADVLIGLQFSGAGQNNFDTTTAKARETREIELVVLKNRNGKTGGRVKFDYYPNFNYFCEKGE